MHHINKTKQTAPSGTWLTRDLTNKEGEGLLRSGRGLQPKTSRRFRPLASWVAACVLLFSPSLPVHGGWLKPDVDFSNYDVPLYDQISRKISTDLCTPRTRIVVASIIHFGTLQRTTGNFGGSFGL